MGEAQAATLATDPGVILMQVYTVMNGTWNLNLINELKEPESMTKSQFPETQSLLFGDNVDL